MALIEIKNLKKSFEAGEVKTPVLNGVSFNIEKGEFVAIMGPSGSGKSTLLHILGFLDDATSGSFRFDQKLAHKYSQIEKARLRNKKMGFIFQSFNLLARATVKENVALPLIYSKSRPVYWVDITRKAIERVGLAHRADYLTSKLSGGEKQRTAIARALVNSPQVIFADEPTGNLDSKTGSQIMDILENLHNQGNTIILITHETYTAQYAQRIIKLRDGLIESDTKVEAPRHNAKKSFAK